MTALVTAILFVAAFLLYLNLPGGKLWREFRQAVASAVEASLRADPESLSPERLAALPEPVRRHLSACGFEGRPMPRHARVECREVAFRMTHGKPPVPVSYDLWLFAGELSRLAFLNARLLGLPFHGMDDYRGEHGRFCGTLARGIPLFHSTASGEEMHRGFLVTLLAEAVLLPSIYLSRQVAFGSQPDPYALEASISARGVEARGTLFFNEEYEIIRFTTQERMMDDGKGRRSLQRWTLEAGDYREEGGVRYPHRIRVIWNLPEGDDVYFDCGDIRVVLDAYPATGGPLKP